MRVICCCCTCVNGEEGDGEREETKNLLHSTVEDQPPSFSRSAPVVSSQPSFPRISTESGDPVSESFDRGDGDITKAVGLLKKYKVKSKHHTKELVRQLSTPPQLRLKVGIKLVLRTATVKVSVVEAHDVLPALQIKGLPDAGSSTEQEHGILIQVRTKIMHSEVRGHTKKYLMHRGLLGALKFHNETVHTIDLEEFLGSKIRFRLYFVMKHQRDKLLGEYTLDITALNVDTNYPLTQTILELYDPSVLGSEAAAKPPVLVPVKNRLLSNEGATVRKKRDPLPKMQRQSRIKSSEVEESQEYSPSTENAVSPKRGISKVFKSLHSGLSKDDASKERERSVDDTVSTGRFATMERMRMAAAERGEKVEELDEAAAAMADSASKFADLGVKIREKYKT